MVQTTSKNSSLSIRDTVMIGVCTAVIAVMAQISIPMPLGVPMTMQTFAITLIAIILGARRAGIAVLIYVLLGAIGVPVFAGFKGGFQSLIGPTGGFLWSFPLMAWLIGIGAERRHHSSAFYVTMLVLGTSVNYIIGVLMFCLIMKTGLTAALTACVIPFIPTAVIKAILASVLGSEIRNRLAMSGWR